MDYKRKIFLEKLDKALDNHKSIGIYGVGGHTELLLKFISEENKQKIIGLIDKDKNKIGKPLYGYKVYSLEEVRDNVKAIVISSDVYQKTIYERISYLKEEGIDIIKIYNDEFFIPTATNIVYEDINNKYEVVELPDNEYDKWNEFVDESPQGAIFNKTWYLEAVQAKFRIYVCIDKGNNILGGMVLPESKPGYFFMPMLTQTLGILVRDFSELKYVNKISKEKDIIESLVNVIPNFKDYSINFNYNFTNWLPFMWKGYNQYCRYTYVIEDLSDLEKVKSEFRYNIKYDINKALKNKMKIVEDLPIEELYKINKSTFTRQDLQMPYSLEFLKILDRQMKIKNSRKSFFVVDECNNVYAGIYVIYDKKSAYYLIGGYNYKLKNVGAVALALWEAIKFSSTVTQKFDFEGSCIRNIEEFFRGFGGIQKIYFNIWKNRGEL
ncbi:GNAT family N-acetyltransferase [Clostridium botulinum]|uniref:GNAT family N-acetyltransferase n=1 Tax=Clostridium botulinum TaxID=1491 RepID=UPI0006A726D7|nr:GNAT family N-acetyltransferase [Clostridium botulinum]APQ97591.1 coA binding domain protein [Clostridium botulinum]KON08803.1 CoA-binding protein [Clostridium botulinum]MBN3362238.1 GNAT family N-acetyltransferase [Clostridium botulinum]MBY6898428.1 GNAT family N-acetyltransferase [Clostridium botulinum]MBY6906051.1 GNAT family N-acetyltransferase [Clostridium botulinum]